MGQPAVRVGLVGYGVIGKRVADAVVLQEDMELIGVAEVAADWRLGVAASRRFPVFAAEPGRADAMRAYGVSIAGRLEDLIAQTDIIVDCTPKKVAAAHVEAYRRAGRKFILQGGEKHETAGHSFVAESSYASALNRSATRVVSCNTTSIVRVFGALRRAGLLQRARGTLLRRATDPGESHLGGIMNTLVPEPHVPSHQGPDAQTVDPELDIVTMAVMAPETLGHMHFWSVDLARAPTRDDVRAALASSSRIAFVRESEGLGAINAVKERMLDLQRPRGDLYEVAVFEEALTVEGGELFLSYMVDNQAIVIPETVDAVRALMGIEPDATASITRTDRTLSIGVL